MKAVYYLITFLALGCLAGALPRRAIADGPSPNPFEKELTLEACARPLREVAKKLSDETGADIQADPLIADWKCTLFFRGKASTAIDAICENYHLQMRRNDQQYRLRLLPDEEQRVARLYAERARAKRSDCQADDEALRKALNRVLDPMAVKRDVEGSLISEGSEPLVELISTFSPAAIDKLSRVGEAEALFPGGRTPTVTVPYAALSSEQRAKVQLLLKGQANRAAQLGTPGGQHLAGLFQDGLARLDGAVISFWITRNPGSQVLFGTVRFPGPSWSADFDIVGADCTAARRRRALESAAKNTPAQTRAEMPQDPNEQKRITAEFEGLDYGESVLQLARRAGVNVVADAFTLRARLTSYPKNVGLAAVLDKVSDTFDVKRRWKDQVLLIRSNQWEEKQEQEPTAETIDYVADLMKHQPALTFADRLWIAKHAPSRKIIGLASWHDQRVSVGADCGRILFNYPEYQWCAKLTQKQLADLQNGKLSVAQLGKAQREALAQLVEYAGATSRAAEIATLSLREDRSRLTPDYVMEFRDRSSNAIAELH